MESSNRELSLHDVTEMLSPSVCAEVIAKFTVTERVTTLSTPLFERLQRKSNDIMGILRSTSNDWNETLYIVLLRFVCGTHNVTAAERLARTVTNRMVMRENSSLEQIEALLLGGAGLLDIYGDDSYVRHLRSEFEHLRAKYDITPLAPSEWQLTGMYIHNHPVLRIAQLAACLNQSSITLHAILDCHKRNDVLNLFSGKASTYWIDNFLPGSHPIVSRRMGSFKSDILGINLVIPMMFAYGTFTNSTDIISRAVELLEDIPAESNRYMKEWQGNGHMPFNAFESQALLQLSKVYCEPKRCCDCPLANHIYHAYAKDRR